MLFGFNMLKSTALLLAEIDSANSTSLSRNLPENLVNRTALLLPFSTFSDPLLTPRYILQSPVVVRLTGSFLVSAIAAGDDGVTGVAVYSNECGFVLLLQKLP